MLSKTLVGLLLALTCGACAGYQPWEFEPVPPTVSLVEHSWATEVGNDAPYWEFEKRQHATPGMLPTGVLVVGTREGRVVAADQSSGRVAWTFDAGEAVMAKPATAAGLVVIGNAAGTLFALNPRNGNEIWRYESGAAIEAEAVIADQQVIFSNANNRLYAVSLRDGTELWSQQRDRTNDYTMLGHGTPTVHEGRVYAGFNDGYLMAYQASDGELVWGRDLSSGRDRFRDADGRPVLDRGDILASSFAGGLYRLDGETGELLWHRDIEGVSTVSVSNNIAYFTSRLGVHAVDATTGDDIWAYLFAAELVSTPPVLGGKYIFVGIQSTGLMVIERSSGRLLGQVDLGTGISGTPLLTRGRLYALSNGGVLYGLKVDDFAID